MTSAFAFKKGTLKLAGGTLNSRVMQETWEFSKPLVLILRK